MPERLAVMAQRGLIPSRPAPHPLAVDIDPTPWGQIDEIRVHPQALLNMDEELWVAVWLFNQGIGRAEGFTLAELPHISGWFYDVWCAMTNTTARLLKSQKKHGSTED